MRRASAARRRAVRPARRHRRARVRHVRRRRRARPAARSSPFSPSRTSRFRSTRRSPPITPRTRLVFLTSPGNPTGLLIPREALRAIARKLPAGALLFLDEAYAEFAGEHFLAELAAVAERRRRPHVRQGLRAGRHARRRRDRRGRRHRAAAARRCRPTASTCCAATVLGGRARRSRLHELVPPAGRANRARSSTTRAIAWACTTGAATPTSCWCGWATTRRAIVDALAARNIFVRDRSTQPGCAGCVRITTGVVEHTEACLAALEEVLCARA